MKPYSYSPLISRRLEADFPSKDWFPFCLAFSIFLFLFFLGIWLAHGLMIIRQACQLYRAQMYVPWNLVPCEQLIVLKQPKCWTVSVLIAKVDEAVSASLFSCHKHDQIQFCDNWNFPKMVHAIYFLAKYSQVVNGQRTV